MQYLHSTADPAPHPKKNPSNHVLPKKTRNKSLRPLSKSHIRTNGGSWGARVTSTAPGWDEPHHPSSVTRFSSHDHRRWKTMDVFKPSPGFPVPRRHPPQGPAPRLLGASELVSRARRVVRAVGSSRRFHWIRENLSNPWCSPPKLMSVVQMFP